MQSSGHWKIAWLFVPALIVAIAIALAFDVALAKPEAPEGGMNADHVLKDGEDNDDDDDDSGRGRGRGRGGYDDDHDHDDDDHDAVIARPDIPDDQLGDVVVEIVDERFVPADFTLEVGQRVTFINLDDDEHTGTGLGFDIGELNPGEWATVEITKGGEIPFVCQFHTEMQGTITVSGGTPVASPIALEATPIGTPSTNAITIDILDFSFSETALEIPAGTTVTWVNQGQAPHTVTGAIGDSGVLQTGESFSFTFGEAGTFDYVCQFHPGMTAQITVT
jgi:plastocyanin